MTMEFELSMQSVAPRLSVPFWCVCVRVRVFNHAQFFNPHF
jgi:hypothetical protein